MDISELLTRIEGNATGISEAARRDPLAPTPQCPGWTVGHIVVHVGRAFRWMEGMVRERAQGPVMPAPNEAAHDRLAPDLVPWFEESLGLFLTTMRETDPDEPVWTWSGEDRAGFWMRLQAHETAVHRTDAQSAFESPDPVDGELARDAIDGLLTWFVPRVRATSLLPCSSTVMRFEETDGTGRWQLRIDDAQVVLETPAGEADVTVRGAVSDLLLYLWQRTGLERLDITGERELAERYRELVPLP
jgi:uncharacterized protein (TIGR03083 family)